MSFVAHAQAHGLIINHAIPDGRWHRVPTVDKPRKRNGAYIFDGNSGVVKNWATMESFARYGEKVSQFIKYRAVLNLLTFTVFIDIHPRHRLLLR